MNPIQWLKLGCILPMAWLSTFVLSKSSIEKRYHNAQRFSKSVLHFLGFTLKINGIENLPAHTSVLFVSNHQGTLDPVLVLASCPITMSFISKKENESMPLFGRFARSIDVLHFDRTTREGNVFMLRESVRRLKSNKSLLIFPEGTRSKESKMKEFKQGAFQPARMAKVAIVPVTLNNAYCLDVKGNRNKNLGIVYGEPILYAEYKDLSQDELSERVYETIQQNLEAQV